MPTYKPPVQKPTLLKTLTFESPTNAEDITFFFTEVAITVQEINAVLLGSSTPSVTIQIKHSSDRSAAGNSVLTSAQAITSTTTGASITSGFSDATIPADSWVWLETTAQSGTVDAISIDLRYTED